MSEGSDSQIVRTVKLPDAQTHEHHTHGQPSKYTDGDHRFERHVRFRRRSIGLRLRNGGSIRDGGSLSGCSNN